MSIINTGTACQNTVIVMQAVNVFLRKSPDKDVFAGEALGNRMILGGVILEITLIMAIGYSHMGNLIFGTAPLAP